MCQRIRILYARTTVYRKNSLKRVLGFRFSAYFAALVYYDYPNSSFPQGYSLIADKALPPSRLQVLLSESLVDAHAQDRTPCGHRCGRGLDYGSLFDAGHAPNIKLSRNTDEEGHE